MPAEYLASQRDFRPLAHAIADACEKARSECSRISGFYRFGFGPAHSPTDWLRPFLERSDRRGIRPCVFDGGQPHFCLATERLCGPPPVGGTFWFQIFIQAPFLEIWRKTASQIA